MKIQFPYKGLILYAVIDEIEIPLLSHYIDGDKNNILRYVISYDGGGVESIIWKASEVNIYNYLNNKITLRELISENDKEFLYNHFNSSLNEDDTVDIIPITNIPEDFLPDVNSYYGFSIPIKYEYLPDKYNTALYVVNLNERGVVLKIAPKSSKYGDTVSLEDAADFTTKVSNSYNAFLEQEFYKNFKAEIPNVKDYEIAKRKILEKASPRICDAEFHSFQITISNDIINNESLKDEVLKWTSNTLHDYADKVLFLDYSKTEVVQSLIESVSPNELKLIYEPIINSISQKNYTVNIRSIGTEKNILFNKNYRNAKKEIKKITTTKLELINDFKKKKLVHMVIEIDEDKNVSELNKSELNKDLITAYESNSFELYLNEINSYEGNYSLINPIVFKIEIVENNNYLISHQYLKNDLLIQDKNLILEEIQKSIHEFIKVNYDGDVKAFLNAVKISYN